MPKFTDDARAAVSYGFDVSQGTHGTVFDPRQKSVKPASAVGKSTIHRESREHLAYYTAHQYYKPEVAEGRGWTWAHQTTNARFNREGGPLGRPVVHEVTPMRGSTVDQDPYTKEWRSPEAGSLVSDRGLTIRDTNWIPPVTPGQILGGVKGIQGTLPHMNWNQFGPNDMKQRNWQELR